MIYTYLGIICPRKKRQSFSSQIHLKLRNMSKAEEFIKKNTKQFSNEDGFDYVPWLTLDQARKAVEIAREEMIEKFYDWLKSNATYIHPRKGTEECITTLVKLKEAMKDE